jgi:hypothetical protein
MSTQTPVTTTPTKMDGVETTANIVTSQEVVEQANNVIESMTRNSTALFAEFTALVRRDPNSDEANAAYVKYKAAEDMLKHYKEAQESFKKTTGCSAPSEFRQHKQPVHAVVPSVLPFLQLKGEDIWKPREEVFDSTHDFCVCFEKVLRAHVQDLNDNWERLLPMCMNKEQIS